MIEGLAMRTGEFILLDIPNHESVQASVRMVQENSGENLLGLCIFRLPGASDKTNLSLNEMVCALKDEAPVPQIDVDIAAEKTLPKSISHLTTTITNSRAVSSLRGTLAKNKARGCSGGRQGASRHRNRRRLARLSADRDFPANR